MMNILLTWGAIFIPCAIALALAGATFGGLLVWLYDTFAVLCLFLGLNFMGKGIKHAKNNDTIVKQEREEIKKLLEELPNAISRAIKKALKEDRGE